MLYVMLTGTDTQPPAIMLTESSCADTKTTGSSVLKNIWYVLNPIAPIASDKLMIAIALLALSIYDHILP